MQFFRTKSFFALLFALVVCGGVFLVTRTSEPTPVIPEPTPQPSWPQAQVIGTSTQGRAITAYTYGTGAQRLVFVGGLHGGYEWNTVLLAYQFMDYLKTGSSTVPKNVSITVIPSANPDGVYKAVGIEGRFTAANASKDTATLASARFSATGVDLNRNFDCNWQATSTWQGRPVGAGTAAFSEPEARALRDFSLKNHPAAVIFWHSAASAVYASACNNGILPGTLAAMNAYATAAKYTAVKSFDAYPITGDAEGWLASVGIPAITVELQTHETVEWERNLAGIKALLELYREKTQ
jgi:predicted deacylase